MDISIVKYNGGNTQSVLFALERLGVQAIITDDVETIRKSDKIIFPGVGEASGAMAYLRERGLDKLIPQLQQPVLGICLGMQLLCTHTEEGDTDCLGVFNVQVKRFKDLKVPHMGWNTVQQVNSALLDNANQPYCYFVHSYYAEECPDTSAITDYGIRFSSALEKNNFYGVQFHPEKSAQAGESIIGKFLNL